MVILGFIIYLLELELALGPRNQQHAARIAIWLQLEEAYATFVQQLAIIGIIAWAKLEEAFTARTTAFAMEEVASIELAQVDYRFMTIHL